MNSSTITQRPEWHFTLVAQGGEEKNKTTTLPPPPNRRSAAASVSSLHADTSALEQRGSDVENISVFRSKLELSDDWGCCCLTLLSLSFPCN